jgi:hypothetical protein
MIDIEEIAARLAAIPTDGVFTANAPSDGAAIRRQFSTDDELGVAM